MMYSTPFQREIEVYWHRLSYHLEYGWKKFITDNNVEVNDTITLEYKGGGLFIADIYAGSGLIKVAPRLPRNCFN